MWNRRRRRKNRRQVARSNKFLRPQLGFEPLEDRRLLAALVSDSFNRSDPGHCLAADNSLGGTQTRYYIDIFPSGGATLMVLSQRSFEVSSD